MTVRTNLHQIALSNLDILNGRTRQGMYPDFLLSDIGDRLLELGFEVDGGEAFCAFYGHEAFVDAGEFQEALERGDDLNALCSGILSQWRFYSHWNYGGMPNHIEEWFVAVLEHLAKITGE